MAIIQISKIQHRSGNIDELPQLSVGELGWATDAKRLFIGNDPDVLGPLPDNTEILTQWSELEAAGYNTAVQFNQEGTFGGSNSFTFDYSSNTLSLGGNFVPQSNTVFNLGSANLNWGNLYLGGNSLYLGGQHVFVSNSALTTSNVTVTGTLISNNLSSNNINGSGNIAMGLNGTFGGNVAISGNLSVAGNITYYDITSLNVSDPVIVLGGGPNGAPLTSNDGKDRGTLLNYYTTQPVSAFMGWDNSNGEFILGSNVTNVSEVITVNTYGNLRAGTIYGNIIGNVTGNVTAPGSNTQIVYNNAGSLAGSANFIFLGTQVILTGTMQANFFAGNGSNLSSLTGSNVVGAVGNATNANVAATVDITNTNGLTTTFYPTFVENRTTGQYVRADVDLTYRTDTNTLGVGNINASGTVNAATLSGTLSTSSQPNITSIGTLSNLSVTGNITSTDLTAGANITSANITGNWTLTSGSRLNATYADLAEFYLGDQKYEPGTVLAFGGRKEVTISTAKNYQKIAGVVTTKPAYVMNIGIEQKGVCIALIGRVPVKVVGKIEKGDLLRASPDHEGVAVSTGDGGIIGRAIQRYNSEEVGLIEVMVGRT